MAEWILLLLQQLLKVSNATPMREDIPTPLVNCVVNNIYCMYASGPTLYIRCSLR